MHVSIPVEHSCEFLEIVPVNPLISKCQIKVCYVDDKPNRNRSIITKETAAKMAASLPGSPIVGFFNPNTGDFEEHNQRIEIANGTLTISDTTVPYGFVDLNAKVWFQKFVDDGVVEREYLMTEGYIWTGQYPEAQRIISEGNNQSMELDEKTLDGTWTKDSNGKPQFFIVNEAIISKLCILGENVEPCFEGAQIAVSFALDEGCKQAFYSMANELKEVLSKGGPSFMTEDMIKESEVITEDVVVEETPVVEEAAIEEVVAEETSTETEFAKAEEEEEKKEESEKEEVVEEEEKPEDNEDEDKKKKEYSLEEIPEYVSLQADYAALETKYNDLMSAHEALQAELTPLKEFKEAADLEAKQQMINSFCMLSEEDKKDVIDNIATYSLEDIEAKLSVICFRNKINFSLEEEEVEEDANLTFNLANSEEDSAPAWIKAIRKNVK